MTIAALALLTAAQTPTTFEDLELAKIEAYHATKNFRLDQRITMHQADQSAAIHVVAVIDGKRSHGEVEAPDGSKMETGSDGHLGWAIMRTLKTFSTYDLDPEKPFNAKDDLLRADSGNFKFKYSTDNQIQFASKPSFKLLGIETVHEGAATLRKVEATAVSKTGRKITLTQWFLPDKWFVKKFSLIGEGETGPIAMSGEATLDFNVPVSNSDFALDKKSIAGYEQTDVPIERSAGKPSDTKIPADGPKTFEELEIAKLSAYHDVKAFQSVMDLSVTTAGNVATMHVRAMRDGERSYQVVTRSDGAPLESGSDGKNVWGIYPDQKVYTEHPADSFAAFDPKASLLAATSNNFKFNFGSDTQMQFASDPAFFLQSIEPVAVDGVKLRKAVASIVNKDGNTIVLTQWFLADKWLLKRFIVTGYSDNGAFAMKGDLTLNQSATIDDKLFTLDPSKVQGYEKRDVPPGG